MQSRERFQSAAIAVTLSVATLSAGCGGFGGSQQIVKPGLSCVDDSSTCVSRRKAALQELVNRPDRSWIQERPTAHAYASGVRLFALRKKKSELTCAELKHGQQEAKRAPAVLGSAGGKNLSAGQISRGKMLAVEVSRDLSREIKRRCS